MLLCKIVALSFEARMVTSIPFSEIESLGATGGCHRVSYEVQQPQRYLMCVQRIHERADAFRARRRRRGVVHCRRRSANHGHKVADATTHNPRSHNLNDKNSTRRSGIKPAIRRVNKLASSCVYLELTRSNSFLHQRRNATYRIRFDPTIGWKWSNMQRFDHHLRTH
jgi:hypothetical protein